MAHEQEDCFRYFEKRLVHIPRERYMEVYHQIREIRAPSIRITSSELARVVNGVDPIESLPAWARNEALDRELDDLITTYPSVWVCPACDSIASFYPGGTAEFVMDSCSVYLEHPVPCPYCGAEEFALFNSQALTRGVPVPSVPEVAPTESVRATPPQVDPAQPSSNETYLEEVLRKRNKEARVESPWMLKFRDTLINLKPAFDREGFDCLGIAWDGVKKTISKESPELAKVAIGLTKTTGMSAFCEQGPNGEKVVALELGLYWTLTHLNGLFDGLIGDGVKGWTWESIIDNAILVISSGRAKVQSEYIPPREALEGQRYFKSFLISTKQLRFILLHELGHLHLGIPSPSSWGREWVEEEKRVDEWVVRLLLSGGDEMEEPWNDKTWLQWRSVWWLFEFWHILRRVSPDSHSRVDYERRRWNSIEELLNRGGADTSAVHRSDVRNVIDSRLSALQ